MPEAHSSLGHHGFSPLDKAAIAASLSAHAHWTLAYSQAGGTEVAQVTTTAPPHHAAPVLTLARHDGHLRFAADWADGSQFCAPAGTCLSAALAMVTQSIEDTRFGSSLTAPESALR